MLVLKQSIDLRIPSQSRFEDVSQLPKVDENLKPITTILEYSESLQLDPEEEEGT